MPAPPAAKVLVAAVAVLLTAGCATAPVMEKSFDFDERIDAERDFASWIDGQHPEGEPDGAAGRLLFGEAAHWRGDLEEAYGHYTAMLREHPGHPLNRYAADRLYRIRGDVAGFRNRIRGDLAGVDYAEESAPTRIALARLVREIERADWKRSDTAEPFDDIQGLEISTWRATPLLSPWRLDDFDEPMAPERSDRFEDRYLSPRQAESDPANYRRVETVSFERSRQRLGLGSRGIYYLESQLSVDSDEPVEITLGGVFPAATRVWIGDREVLGYDESRIRPARLVRPIELQPGEHRVLVKMAYAPGTRDWFELVWAPSSGAIFDDVFLRSSPQVESADGAAVDLVGKQRAAERLEPVVIPEAQIEGTPGAELYLAAVSAYITGASELFEPVWTELMERHPEFVAGHLLGSDQVRTRWDVPSDVRQSRAISRLRRAERIAPDNLAVLVALQRRLGRTGEDRELRRIAERARRLAYGTESSGAPTGSAVHSMEGEQGRGRPVDEPEAVRPLQLRPLVAWANYLDDRGWSREAERAWEEVLEVDAGHCRALRRLQQLHQSRNHFADVETLSPLWRECPRVVDRWTGAHPERLGERLAFLQRRAQRHPWNANHHRRYAEALRAAGERDRAVDELESALERMPEDRRLWNARIRLAAATGDSQAHRSVLQRAIAEARPTGDWVWQLARLDGGAPLEEFLRDGRQRALDEIARTGTRDEIDESDASDDESRAMVFDDAYYVVDSVARHHFEDGSSMMLTHKVVRAMTRNAIDDYAEMSIPSGAEPLRVRTIKQNGGVRVPDGVTGDSTVSMPGLSRGDMVEVAYLEFYGPGSVATRRDGNRFYFQMNHISSRLSELVVLGSEGIEFDSANGAPAAEHFQWKGREAVRFRAEDVRRPRSESRRVNLSEYLPWVRESRSGLTVSSLDYERRHMRETFIASARSTPEIDDTFADWLGRDPEASEASDDEVRRLFYATTDRFRRLSPGSYSTDAAHALQTRRGSPLVVMHLALSKMGVDHEVYLARTDEMPPQRQDVGEIGRFRRSLLKVRMPESGEVVWLQMNRRDAMFGAVEPEVDGQPAVCVTCRQFREATVTIDADRRPRRHIELVGQIDAEGTLEGALTYQLHGVRAERVRSALRARSDSSDRREYFERVLTDQISGADLVDFTIHREEKPDREMVFEMQFRRPGFAGRSNGRLVVDRTVFDEPMQQIYATESSRQTPLFVGYEREQSYSGRIELPDGYSAELRGVDVEPAEVPFGQFRRHSRLEDGVLHIDTAIHLPRQRVAAEDYAAFRRWVRRIEESGRLWLELTAEVGDES